MLGIATEPLLSIHIASGSVALAASLAAAGSKVLRMPHRLHVVTGRIFGWAMLGIVLTALPLAFEGGSLLLLLVAVLSGYLAFVGWREAVRRAGTRSWIDHMAAILMAAAGAVMSGWGGLVLVNGHGGGIVLVAFGVIGLFLSVGDLLRAGRPVDQPTRLVIHMSRMMGATISVLTAFLVVNVRFEPGWIVWLAPTVVLTPLIFWMAGSIRSAKLR